MKKVIVNRRTVYNRRGEPELVATKDYITEVTAELMGNKVRTVSGDVWRVVPCHNGKADFIVDEPCG